MACFRPGKLGEKLDFLARRVDYYLKGEDRNSTLANPQNLCPVFSQEQFTTSLRSTRLQEVTSDIVTQGIIFIPTADAATAVDVADAFATHVSAKHGILLHVSSDHGSEFTSHFFHSLGALLFMCIHLTSGHHPSANGQVDRVNSTLGQLPHIYCNY